MPSRPLDLVNAITQKDRATPYFEDLIYQLYLATNIVPIVVAIDTNVATVDLTKGSQFNITADDDFEIVITGVENRVSNRNAITITNPAGAFDLTDITSDGVTVYKVAGSTIAILGGDRFWFALNVPADDEIDMSPLEMEPV